MKPLIPPLLALSMVLSLHVQTVFARVHALPAETDTSLYIQGSLQLCPGDTLLLTAGTNATYQWKKNGIPITGATHAQLKVSDEGSYYVVVSNGAGIIDSSRIVQVTVLAQPTAAITISNSQGTIAAGADFCYNNSTGNLSASGGYTSYTWNIGSSSLTSSTGVVLSNYSGAVTVHGIGANGCPSAGVSVTATYAPADTVPVITRVGDNLQSSTSRYYRWYFNNQLMNGETNSYVPVTKQGIYYVMTSSNNVCWNSSLKYVALYTTSSAGDSLKTTAYPNPVSNGSFNIVLSYNKVKSVEVKVVVTGVAGNIVWQSNKLLFRDKFIRIPVNATLSAGTYFVSILANGESRSMTVVVN